MTTEACCDACGRRNSWGCGHTSEQRRDARRHKATKLHREGACACFDHSECDPTTCKLAKQPWPPGYVPFVKHADAVAHFAKLEVK